MKSRRKLRFDDVVSVDHVSCQDPDIASVRFSRLRQHIMHDMRNQAGGQGIDRYMIPFCSLRLGERMSRRMMSLQSLALGW